MADITEHKRTEEELRESEGRYRCLVENARDAIFTIAPDGSVGSLNPAFETITGWSRTDWVGKPFGPIIHAQDVPLAMEVFRRVFVQGETPPIFELRLLSKSGDYVVGEFTITPQHQNEKVVSALCIARDITERKQAQARQALLTDEIQHRTKNLFAVVHAVVARSFAAKETIGEARDAVLSRLESLVPLLLFWRAPIRRLMLTSAALLFLIGGVVPLLWQIGSLPTFLLIASGWEILAQNGLAGLVAAWLLRIPALRDLGPDPLSGSFDAADAVARLMTRGELDIADALLDQSAIAGLGNIFKSEVLFAGRVNPFAKVRDLAASLFYDPKVRQEGARVEIQNTGAREGAARDVADRLSARAYGVSDVTNGSSAKSAIVLRNGSKRYTAEQLKTALGLPIETSDGSGPDIVVRVGADFRGFATDVATR